MQFEEAFNLFTFSSSTAHQEVTKLVNWPQFLEDVTPLQPHRFNKLGHCYAKLFVYNMTSHNSSFNLCREEDKLLRKDVVLLNHHRGISNGDLLLVQRGKNLGRLLFSNGTKSPRVSIYIRHHLQCNTEGRKAHCRVSLNQVFLALGY